MEEIRYRNNLAIMGIGVILFAAWGVIKNVAFMLWDPETHNLLLSQDYTVAVIILCCIMMAVDLLIRLYVGFSAFAEGRFGLRKRFYLFLSFILMLESAGTIIFICYGFSSEFSAERIASCMIELTSAWILGDMIYTAARLRKMNVKG